MTAARRSTTSTMPNGAGQSPGRYTPMPSGQMPPAPAARLSKAMALASCSSEDSKPIPARVLRCVSGSNSMSAPAIRGTVMG
ncbi:Uncharacterised protein [Bordetella pertussis]|nr:Uncharacterised protein [Bordetella pertussis]CFO39068.1 Uncharacterised protein [Bordetella pertussis]CFP12760.1 Uncharacterised protein [Bordetella pertussis]CFP60198.1 Uncharacterised protein [Bordetella pertussis]CFW10551.1 Uncharacterised protein [Bordetella pertussis]